MQESKLLNVLNSIFHSFIDALPNVLAAIGILIVGWLIAKFIANLIRRLLVSLKVDRFAEKLNEIEIIEKSNIKIVPSVILSKFVYYIVLLFAMIVATEQLHMPSVSNLVGQIINYLPNLITALILLGVGLLFAEFIRKIVVTTGKSIGIPSANIIGTVIFYFILINVLLSALSQAKVKMDFINTNLSVIIAGVAFAFAIGYGLASKNQMANMLSSFQVKKRFNVGDKISVGGYKGEIIEIDNNAVTLKNENKKIIIPLSTLTSESVEILS